MQDGLLLDLQELETRYSVGRADVYAVRNVSLKVHRGEILGLVGESGCGKSTLGYSILRILPENGRIVGGRCLVEGSDLFSMSEDELAKYRWAKVSMIFQGAMNALNPVLRVDDILFEILRAHKNVSRSEAVGRIEELFDLVGITRDHMSSYAHELSGGMRQRVVIAMSLLCDPSLIIADEPTTAFDVIVQDQILGALENIQRKLGIGMMLITHDIAVIAETCDTVAVMYAGQIVEQSSTEAIFRAPAHPYTAAMLNSFPALRGPKKRLVSLQGAPPDLTNPPQGCAFAPRCPLAVEKCWETPPPLKSLMAEPQHLARCYFAGSGAVIGARVAKESQARGAGV